MMASIHLCFANRFLYPIYPLICLAAAAVIERFPDLVQKFQAMHEESILVQVNFDSSLLYLLSIIFLL